MHKYTRSVIGTPVIITQRKYVKEKNVFQSSDTLFTWLNIEYQALRKMSLKWDKLLKTYKEHLRVNFLLKNEIYTWVLVI